MKNCKSVESDPIDKSSLTPSILKGFITFLVLWVNLTFAIAGTGNLHLDYQEIGIPFFKDREAYRTNSFFSKNGDSFFLIKQPSYAKNDELPSAQVMHYQFKPLKKLATYKMPALPSPFGRYSADKIFDIGEGKLVFANVKSLMLYDTRTHKILNKLEFKEFSKGVIYVGGQIVTLNHNSNELGYRFYDPLGFELIKKELVFSDTGILKPNPNEDYSLHQVAGYPVVSIYESTSPKIIFYNPNTFKLLLSAQCAWYTECRTYLSKDRLGALYVLTVSKVNSKRTSSYKAMIAIDLKTLQFKTYDSTHDSFFNSSLKSNTFKYSQLRKNRGGEKEGYLWAPRRLFDGFRKEFLEVYSLENQELVLYNEKTKKFITTASKPEGFFMENSSGEIVPMNESTFNHFLMDWSK